MSDNFIHASQENPCPICRKEDWCYQLNPSLWCCKRSDEAPPEWHRTTKQDRDGAWYFGIDNDDHSDRQARKEEWQRLKAERESNHRESQQQEFPTQLTSAQRDPLIRALSQELGLTSKHRKILRDRGLTDEQINTGLYFSIGKWQKVGDRYPLNLPGVHLSPNGDRQLNGKGIAIVAIDADGLATGWQVMNDNPRPTDPDAEFAKYYWAKGDKSSHLPIGDGELPIQVIGTRNNHRHLWVCESLLKSVVASYRINDSFIGAASGLFRSSPIQVKAALAGIEAIIIAVDAGDVGNPQRVRHWRLETEFFKSLGLEVQFAWWGQISKTENDIDELTPDELSSIEYLTPDRLFAIAALQLRDEGGEMLLTQQKEDSDPATDKSCFYYSSDDREGLVWNTVEKQDDGTFKPIKQHIGDHIEAIAYVEDPEGGNTGVLLEFITQRERIRRILIPRIALTGDGLEALRCLADRGYHYIPKRKRELVDYLFGLGGEVERIYVISAKTGWVNGSFLTPAKTYGDLDLRFRNPEPDTTFTEIKGSLAEWICEVAVKCEGNSRLIFGLGAAFAAALLEIAQIESGGFHLVGPTTIGKTTVLGVVASVTGLKNIPNWRSTSNALEGTAAEFNHSLLPLDEIGQADPQTVGASAYMLGNSQGKGRMAKTLVIIKPKTWLLLFLSTGEVGMGDYLRQARITLKGGMEARMPSIPADAGKGYGVFENLHGSETSGEFVQLLETAIRRYRGTAQDAYLTQLVAARKVDGFDKQLRERVHTIARELSKKHTDSAIGRVAVRFALVQVGLELAHSYNLLPFPLEQCTKAVKQMFDDWVNVRGGAGSIEIKEACNKIEHLLESTQYGDRIQILRKDAQSQQYSIENGSPCRNMIAYKAADSLSSSIEYWVPPTIFNKEFADGVDRTELAKELQARGWLKPSGDKNRDTLRRSIGEKRQYFFVFREFWLDPDEEKPDSESGEKPLNQLNQLNQPPENLADTSTQNGSGWFSTENGLEPTEPTCNRKENISSLQAGSSGSVQKTLFEPTLNKAKPLIEEGFEGIGSVGSVGSVENHITQNVPKKITRFKVGDRVRYIGSNANLLNQYAGTMEVYEIQHSAGEQSYTCQKSNGKLTSWIEFTNMELVEVSV